MISIIKYPSLKKKCQVFTPTDIVTKMLDLVDYRCDLVGKTVLETCCGDGQFLSQIVERYIKDAYKKGLNPESITFGLEQDLTAYEIDEKLVESCKQRLDIIASRHKLYGIHWNIVCGNYLDDNIAGHYDYIVGNPPYIAYQDLPSEAREELKDRFSTCKKGKFDYCFAFIEKAYNMLTCDGRMAYIIPSNIFKNAFADELRSLIKDDLTTIVDYPQDNVFSDVLVSPAIIVLNKSINTNELKYLREINKKVSTSQITKDNLKGKWVFEAVRLNGKRVGDYFKVSNAIATLCNRVYVLRDGVFDGDFFCVGEERIESAILRVAVSPKSKRYSKEKTEYIIFPYGYNKNGDLLRYNEKDIETKYPNAMRYLRHHKSELDKRDSDKSAKWFEYGRSQALQKANQKMIMISTVISENTKAYMLNAEEIPYSGLYIISTGGVALERLLSVLNSKRFKDYASSVGVNISGSSTRITAKDIENYVF